MLEPNALATHLSDYTPPPFLIPTVELDIDISEDRTVVSASLSVERNPDAQSETTSLVLDGHLLELLSVTLDGKRLSGDDYQLDEKQLCIASVPERFRLETKVTIEPETNTQLEGLYASKDGYFTQCEAEGFRRITFFPDRPDVMSRYTTTIRANKERFPLLLSNGNLIDSGEIDDRRHWARWLDPFPKPAYLFAMVAARLDLLESDFTTVSGRDVKLRVYVEPGKLDQCSFAMEALKSAMRWDEEVFGLELDLDQYMIVAVGDFNMGAMENKGLNIFNTKYVLARADTATDHDFMMLDRVVAHEYFHNWTGNRVTCRDWFQLSLKEGLTVFRDQQYGGDRYSHAVQRIQEVRLLRAAQFPEDAGPMAHPVRPESYVEISNFYTATVYNKGAEVVRMIHTLIGAENFRSGMDLYFARHDGQAVRTEEFAQAMQDASGVDLGQFRRWYSQAGTPEVTITDDYDEGNNRYTLHCRQHCPATPDQDMKLPFHIPMTVGLLDQDGNSWPLSLPGEDPQGPTHSRVLSLTQAQQSFSFEGIDGRPVPSLFRGFSAPVELRFDYSDEQLALLAAHDPDPFNRWEAGQRLALDVLLKAVAVISAGREAGFSHALLDAFGRILADADDDPAFAAEALSLPSAGYIAEQMDVVDPDAIQRAQIALRRRIAETYETELAEIYLRFEDTGPYSPEPAPAGRRALRNAALGYLMELEQPALRQTCLDQLTQADNLTNAMAALSALANYDCAERSTALDWFYQRWSDEPLVLDKWFAVQANSRLPTTLDTVRSLLQHPDFSLKNPNRVRAVIGAFCHGNHAGFHALDGSGYAFGAEQVIALDGLNPQVAARMARAFDRWKKFDRERQGHAKAALTRIQHSEGLSKDTAEVVNRALA